MKKNSLVSLLINLLKYRFFHPIAPFIEISIQCNQSNVPRFNPYNPSQVKALIPPSSHHYLSSSFRINQTGLAVRYIESYLTCVFNFVERYQVARLVLDCCFQTLLLVS